ncbi:MAG: DUF929 family protein [Xanthomonadaceae bacterium]|nr:DUF929 family protein [Xanthomonadaceae bacterium]
MPRISRLALAIVSTALALMQLGAAQAQTAPGTTPPALAARLNRPVAPALLEQLEQASAAGLQLVTRPMPVDVTEIQGPSLGKPPVLLYVGADFCPYCASQRWGLLLTLLRFGRLTGVHYMLSSASDVYANTATFTFQFSRYTSPYLRFQAFETADRDQQSLMPMTPQATAIFQTYDVPPYAHFSYGIPFVYLNGAYLLTVPMISPASLQDLSWEQIAAQLADPRSALFRATMPQVNLLSAAICRVDGHQPARICTAPGVIAADGSLSGLAGMMLR